MLLYAMTDSLIHQLFISRFLYWAKYGLYKHLESEQLTQESSVSYSFSLYFYIYL